MSITGSTPRARPPTRERSAADACQYRGARRRHRPSAAAARRADAVDGSLRKRPRSGALRGDAGGRCSIPTRFRSFWHRVRRGRSSASWPMHRRRMNRTSVGSRRPDARNVSAAGRARCASEIPMRDRGQSRRIPCPRSGAGALVGRRRPRGPRPRRRRHLVRRHANRPLGADHQLSRGHTSRPVRAVAWRAGDAHAAETARRRARSRGAARRDGARYHGFNLLVGDDIEVAFASNRASGALSLGAGIYGLSNHLLDTPWPKLAAQQGAPGRMARRRRPGDRDRICATRRSPARSRCAMLPATGVSPSGKACSRRRSSSARSTGRARRPSC